MMKKVVITDAWFKHDGKLMLNSALKPYEKALLAMKKTWSASDTFTPLSWFANLADVSPSALLAALPDKGTLPMAKQFWVASPYHARLTRSVLRVMPDSMLDWSAKQTQDICDILNPLLKEDGLELHGVGETLLLSSQHVWDVTPVSFADVSGASLPDRHTDSKDAGRWIRLLSEIQMMLHQSPLITANGLNIHGLWLWGAANSIGNVEVDNLPCVATSNVYLKSVLKTLDKEQNATMIVTDAAALDMLLPVHKTLPKQWLLLGAGQSVALSRSRVVSCLAKVKIPVWKGM